MSDSDSGHRVLRSIGNVQQSRIKKSTRAQEACCCESELTELRKEVTQLTKTINEMNSILYAKLLFPHLSLDEALAEKTEVTYDHVKPPKRPRTDSARYLPDIPDGFSDSTAHSLAFRRRTKATTTEQECKRALKKLRVNPDSHESDATVLDAIKVVSVAKSVPTVEVFSEAKRTKVDKKKGGSKTKTSRSTRSSRAKK
ncbi:hypothetical protein Q9L58_007983 [Maublancomyces gigas]|uniref:Uncharacterized protein n=1 Tax=Discina gigas TaxID=1032678 RepID=A0ABR3GB17_9PEZI